MTADEDDEEDEGLVGLASGRNSTAGFGLLSDRDGLWTHARETQHQQVSLFVGVGNERESSKVLDVRRI